MLAQSHARKPAPPLAARGMWLRLGVGADAFGSALGDAVVGSITKGDAGKAQAKNDRGQVYRDGDADRAGLRYGKQDSTKFDLPDIDPTLQMGDGAPDRPEGYLLADNAKGLKSPPGYFERMSRIAGSELSIADKVKWGLQDTKSALYDTFISDIPALTEARDSGLNVLRPALKDAYDLSVDPKASFLERWAATLTVGQMSGMVGVSETMTPTNGLGVGLSVLGAAPAVKGLYSEMKTLDSGLSLWSSGSARTPIADNLLADNFVLENYGPVAAKAEFRSAPRTGLEFSTKFDGEYLELESRQKFTKDGSIVPALGVRSELVSRFNNESGNLFVNFYRTTEEGRGVGTEMLSRAIEHFGPEQVKTVSAELGLTNKKVFEHYVNVEGLSAAQAVQRTPIGKSLGSLGYGQIDVNGLSIVARKK